MAIKKKRFSTQTIVSNSCHIDPWPSDEPDALYGIFRFDDRPVLGENRNGHFRGHHSLNRGRIDDGFELHQYAFRGRLYGLQ